MQYNVKNFKHYPKRSVLNISYIILTQGLKFSAELNIRRKIYIVTKTFFTNLFPKNETIKNTRKTDLVRNDAFLGIFFNLVCSSGVKERGGCHSTKNIASIK